METEDSLTPEAKVVGADGAGGKLYFTKNEGSVGTLHTCGPLKMYPTSPTSYF